MKEIDKMIADFNEICNSIDKSNKQLIINLEKLQNNLQKELFNYHCTPDFSNEPACYADIDGV